MYHCRFRALTELGDPFYFSVADVPVKVYPDMFILAARSGSSGVHNWTGYGPYAAGRG